jgi:hypothetical protein
MTKKTKRQYLTTFGEVVTALGGVTAVARLTGRTPSAVCNWRRTTGKFPPALYRKIGEPLKKKGYCADMSVWGFEAAA